MKTYRVWPISFGDDDIDNATTCEAYDAESVAEVECEARHADWDYPSEITVKVLEDGKPEAEAVVFDVTVESRPCFYATDREVEDDESI